MKVLERSRFERCPLLGRIEGLWVLLDFMKVWRSFAIGGNMVT